MARPQRNNVDYFPHPVNQGRKMGYIIKKYGPEGYFIWYRLLELLGSADYHYLNLSTKTQLMLTSSDLNTSETRLTEVLDDLAEFDSIHKLLWIEHSVVFSEKFVSEIKDAYLRRSNDCITLESLCKHLSIKLKHKPGKCSISTSINPQSKVKKSRITSPDGPEAQKPNSGDNQDLRPHKEVLEEIIGFFGLNPKTKTDWSRVGKLAREYGQKGATLDSLMIRADLYKREWPKITMTPEALLKHWDLFAEKERQIVEAEKRKKENEEKLRREFEEIEEPTQEQREEFNKKWREALG